MNATETASQELTDRVLAALMEQTDARRAQFASYLPEAKQGTLTQVRAWGVLRQLRGMVAPAEGEEPRERRASNGETRTSTRSNDASEAQARFAADVLRTRVAPDERIVGTVKTATELLAAFEKSGRMSRDLARTVIDLYKDRPRLVARVEAAPKAPQAPQAPKAPKAAPVELRDGIYRLGDDWYKVVHAVHGSGRQYAKRVVVSQDAEGNPVATFEYEGNGPLRKLTPEHRVGLEEAKQFGDLYGVCLKCGATLTDEESMADNIGPYCSGRKGSAQAKAEAAAYWA